MKALCTIFATPVNLRLLKGKKKQEKERILACSLICWDHRNIRLKGHTTTSNVPSSRAELTPTPVHYHCSCFEPPIPPTRTGDPFKGLWSSPPWGCGLVARSYQLQRPFPEAPVSLQQWPSIQNTGHTMWSDLTWALALPVLQRIILPYCHSCPFPRRKRKERKGK